MIFKNEDNNEKRRYLITEMLKRSVCTVTFTKVNGENRTMPCTLRDDFIPQVELKESKEPTKERKKSDTVLSVWCTDKNEWRSFRLENVTEIIPNE